MTVKHLQKQIYRRVLLKLSGEALQGVSPGVHPEKLAEVSARLAKAVRTGVQIGLVIGGGNIIRGVDFVSSQINRVTADQMGMLATLINGLALRDALQKQSIPVKLMSAFSVAGTADLYHRYSAIEALEQGHLVIFAGGTGNPLFTTDSAAALRAVEIQADVLIKATKVNGVFDADPLKHPDAKYYPRLTYHEVLEQRLGVMDLSAIILCQEHQMPLRVLNMNQPDALSGALSGEAVGTLIQG
jgi:uridylate kinase